MVHAQARTGLHDVGGDFFSGYLPAGDAGGRLATLRVPDCTNLQQCVAYAAAKAVRLVVEGDLQVDSYVDEFWKSLASPKALLLAAPLPQFNGLRFISIDRRGK